MNKNETQKTRNYLRLHSCEHDPNSCNAIDVDTIEVMTTEGLIPLGAMQVKDVIFYDDNARTTATEYYYLGKMVKRAVTVQVLRPVKVHSKEGNVND